MNPTENLNENTLQGVPKIQECDVAEYVFDRYKDLLKQPSVKDLVTFHSNNKYLLMAHNQEKLKILGNIVANHDKKQLNELLSDYQFYLLQALNCKPTIKTHINVLMHIFGFFGKYLSQKEKQVFLDFVKEYREKKTTLGKILSEIEPITYNIDTMYLVSQTYFLLYSERVIGGVSDTVYSGIFSD